MTTNPPNIGAAPEEYPIRALVLANMEYQGQPAMYKHRGKVIRVRLHPSPRVNLVIGPEGENDGGWAWWIGRDVILDPTPEQIAEERAKAGLPPQEGEALPEAKPKGPSPSEVPQPGEGVDLEEMRNALLSAPIHLLGESLESFLERYKHWYREIRRAALGKAGAA